MKKYPNYITKNWQYRSWIAFGLIGGIVFAVNTLEAPQYIVPAIGSCLMTARLIVMRHRWKKSV